MDKHFTCLVKVCGMRDAENIRSVEALGVDWMGFIFWPHSNRFVSERPAYLPTKAKRVGVFVDEETDTVLRIAADYALDLIQLHGSESPAYLRALRQRLADEGSPVVIIKAFNIATAADFTLTATYAGLADYFLFDTKAHQPGGNGQQFDWSVLTAYNGDTPFLLSGGIGPDDAKRLHQAFALDGFPVSTCLGIDLNSRFESAPALKDVNALQQFLSRLNRLQ